MLTAETLTSIFKDKTKKHVIVEICDDAGRVRPTPMWYQIPYAKKEVERRGMILGQGYGEPISKNAYIVVICAKRALTCGGGWKYDSKSFGMKKTDPQPYGDIERQPINPDALIKGAQYLKGYVDDLTVIDIDAVGPDAYQLERVLKTVGTVVNHGR